MDVDKNLVSSTKIDLNQALTVQYLMIVESINQINTARETSNYFWITANSIIVTALSYTNTLSDLTSINRNTLVGSLFFIGYLLCLIWASYLNTIRIKVKLHYEKLRLIENYFPIKLFQEIYAHLGKEEGRHSVYVKELLVPLIFISAYTLLGINFFYKGGFLLLPVR